MNNLDINLNLYRSFYYVAKYEGFTKASQYALISQSSLSSNVKRLEEELGIKLFERKVSNIKLTKEGQELLFKLEEIITILNNEQEVKEINIGCLRFIGDNYLEEAIRKFKKKYPLIKINFTFTHVTELYQMLKKDELDLVISRYPYFHNFDKHIKVEKIKDVENVFACSTDYYQKEYKKMFKKDYIYKLILPDPSEKQRIIEQYLIDKDINYEVSIEIPNSNLLKNLILNNLGIGYINKKAISNEIKNNQITILNQFENLPLDNISIIYNSQKNNQVIEDFILYLKSTI